MAVSTKTLLEITDSQTAEPVIIEAAGKEQIHLDQIDNLFSSSYLQSGPDLVLTQQDGAEFIIRDFFASDSLPTLTTSNGSVANGDFIVANIQVGSPIQVAQTAQANDASGTEPIGVVETASGTVTAVHLDGTTSLLEKGAPVFQGDTVQTSGDGAVGIIFADDSSFSLAADGEIILDEMVYDPEEQSGEAAITLAKGIFTFVSGQIAKTGVEAMVISTPNATIGIRGTKGGIDATEGRPLSVVLAQEDDGTVGEITVTNAAGTQVLNQAYQATTVTGFNVAPSAAASISPAQFNAGFKAALNALPPPSAVENRRQQREAEKQAIEAQEGEKAAEEEAQAEAEALAEGEAPPGEEPLPEGEGELAEGEGEAELATDGDGELLPEDELALAEEALEEEKLVEGEQLQGENQGEPSPEQADAQQGEQTALEGQPPQTDNDQTSSDETQEQGAVDQNSGDLSGESEGGAEAPPPPPPSTETYNTTSSSFGPATTTYTSTVPTYTPPPTTTSNTAPPPEDNYIASPPPPDPYNAINGTGAADVLTGTAGNDSFVGGAGTDTIIASGGNDVIKLNITDDQYDVLRMEDPFHPRYVERVGTDLVVHYVNENDGSQASTLVQGVYSDTNFAVKFEFYDADKTPSLETHIVASQDTSSPTSLGETGTGGVGWVWAGTGANENVTAASEDDIMFGGAGDDTLDGGAGDDHISGGLGNDVLTGGANGTDGDTVDYYDATSGIVADLITGSVTGGGGTDTISGFENIEGSMYGDTLNGTTGDNHIYGNAGDDTLYGDAGNDHLEGGAGDDYIDGYTGTDTVQYEHATGAVNVNLATSVATGAGTDTLVSIENIDGSQYNDTLTGDNSANHIYGGDGDDTISLGGGADSVVGGLGQDTISLGSADTVTDQIIYNLLTEAGDTVSGFETSYDKILFASSEVGLGAGALAGTEFKTIASASTYSGASGIFGDNGAGFVFNTTTNELSYDSNGDDAGGYTTVATVTGDGALSATNIEMF